MLENVQNKYFKGSYSVYIHKHVELEKSCLMILRTLFYIHVHCIFHVTSRYFLNII